MRIMKAMAGAIIVSVLAGMGSAWASTQSGPERFFVYGAGATFEPDTKVVASGPISGVGEARTIDDRGTQSQQDFTVELVFPNGTVTVDLQGPATLDVNWAACAGVLSGTLRWTITGGTGVYARASGSGSGTFAERFVVERGPDGCQQDDALIAVLTSHLSGTASA